jgi:hypothetical protein
VFHFRLQILSETFILRRTDRNMIKHVYWALCKGTRHFCQILIKIEFSRQIFEKCSNVKFNENPCIGSRVFSMRTDGRTDGLTD